LDIADEEKDKKAWKVEAQKEKEIGNVDYKNKYFEIGIQHYTKVVDLDDEDISFLTN
jgi:stress-induced-phosphoprotein 1